MESVEHSDMNFCDVGEFFFPRDLLATPSGRCIDSLFFLLSLSLSLSLPLPLSAIGAVSGSRQAVERCWQSQLSEDCCTAHVYLHAQAGTAPAPVTESNMDQSRRTVTVILVFFSFSLSSSFLERGGDAAYICKQYKSELLRGTHPSLRRLDGEAFFSGCLSSARSLAAPPIFASWIRQVHRKQSSSRTVLATTAQYESPPASLDLAEIRARMRGLRRSFGVKV